MIRFLSKEYKGVFLCGFTFYTRAEERIGPKYRVGENRARSRNVVRFINHRPTKRHDIQLVVDVALLVVIEGRVRRGAIRETECQTENKQEHDDPKYMTNNLDDFYFGTESAT